VLQKRVVVTGMGVVSPVGNELDTFFDNLCAGKSGISAIESFDCEGWPTRIAGEVKDFEPGDLISRKMSRRLDRSIKFSLYAGKKALLDAKLPIEFKGYVLLECLNLCSPLSSLL
jgi:3-oxoacyl-[acyl-carrier-protein] synthase II